MNTHLQSILGIGGVIFCLIMAGLSFDKIEHKAVEIQNCYLLAGDWTWEAGRGKMYDCGKLIFVED